jgi:hypothetical protein
LAGTIDLNQFYRWFVMNGSAIELRGTDDEVDFHNTIENLFAEYTGDHISAGVLLEALREEYGLYVAQRELATSA